MTLPINKELKYVSPSSFLTWQSCAYRVYLEKCSGLELPEDTQSAAAAVGTVFDIIVKKYLCGLKGWGVSDSIWNNLTLLQGGGRFIEAGLKLANLYIKNRPNVFNIITSVDMEAKVDHDGVTIFGYPDAQVLDRWPLDWKTRGYGATYHISPKPGYEYCIDLISGEYYKGKHKEHGEPLDRLMPSWATQLLFYCWMMGVTDDYKGWIQEIIYQKERILLAHHHGEITDEFVDETKKEMVKMWEMMATGEGIPEPEPSKGKCFAYGQRCRAADYCNRFKQWEAFYNDDE